MNITTKLISKEFLFLGYNIWTIAIIYILVCIGPLPIAEGIPVLIAFILNLYRLFRYDVRSYLLDIIILIPLANIYKLAPQTPSVVLYLILFGCIFFLVKNKIHIKFSLLFALVYFLIRSGFLMDSYISIAASLIFLAMFASNINKVLALKVSMFFCISVALSTLWAYIFKNTNYFEAYVMEDMQLSRTSDLLRFKGLFVDPNYFGTFLLIAISIVFQLYLCNLIKLKIAVALISIDVLAGIITYSKSFLLTLASLFLILSYFIWKSKNRATSIGITLALVTCVFMVILGELGSVSVILERFEGQTDINEITTGRLDLWITYFNDITSSITNFLFGHGLDASLLIQGSHNLYLEVFYYVGFLGIIAIIALINDYFKPVFKEYKRVNSTGRFVGILSCFVFLILYWSLQGMFSFTTYIQICVVVSMCLVPLCSLNK